MPQSISTEDISSFVMVNRIVAQQGITTLRKLKGSRSFALFRLSNRCRIPL